MIKVLNLYCGIGGNRKLWSNNEIEVTAVENNPQIAAIYQEFFPMDKIIVTDAHQYLLEHYKEFDFIWSSPPCPTHSVVNGFLNAQGVIRYPDFRLYEEIVFLRQWFKGKFVIENVYPYYFDILAWKPSIINRHCFWTNFVIGSEKLKYNVFNTLNARHNTRENIDKQLKKLLKLYQFDDFIAPRTLKIQVLRNCVNPKLGLHIFNSAFKEIQEKLICHKQ